MAAACRKEDSEAKKLLEKLCSLHAAELYEPKASTGAEFPNLRFVQVQRSSAKQGADCPVGMCLEFHVRLCYAPSEVRSLAVFAYC